EDGAGALSARFATLQRGAGVAEFLAALDRGAERKEGDRPFRGHRKGAATAACDLLVILVEVVLHLERDEDGLPGRLGRSVDGTLIGGTGGQKSGQGRHGERDSGHVVS